MRDSRVIANGTQNLLKARGSQTTGEIQGNPHHKTEPIGQGPTDRVEEGVTMDKDMYWVMPKTADLTIGCIVGRRCARDSQD